MDSVMCEHCICLLQSPNKALPRWQHGEYDTLNNCNNEWQHFAYEGFLSGHLCNIMTDVVSSQLGLRANQTLALILMNHCPNPNPEPWEQIHLRMSLIEVEVTVTHSCYAVSCDVVGCHMSAPYSGYVTMMRLMMRTVILVMTLMMLPYQTSSAHHLQLHKMTTTHLLSWYVHVQTSGKK